MNFPLAGNDRVKQAVTAAIKEDRIPHALLIEGDPGTGKHTLSRYLSAAAVCTGENRPCGECRACKQAEALIHPDIRITAPEDGKRNLLVGQIRALREEAYIRPQTAARRVFVIDKADTMNAQAQNALLKVLEEPPGQVLFLLLAESSAALLPTVRSRCTILSLFPASKEESDALSNAAEQFLTFFSKGEELQMLTVLAPFSAKRVETDRLFKALKLACRDQMRASLSSPAKVRRLSRLYDVLADCEEALVTNINLNLLFCSLVSQAAGIYLD